MAIQWGAWEYSGGNGMRVGIDVSWETITHGEAVATCTIEIYTENQFAYGDGQTLNYGGSIGGSTSFTNNAGGAPVLRATKTYDYTYGANSYGSSPGSRTFSATLSGAYNGVTPSKSVTTNIPARPIAAPAPPTAVVASRISDTSAKLTWNNNPSAGEPYETLSIQRQTDGGSWITVSHPGGGTESFTSNTSANHKYRFQIRSNNDAGSSSYVLSGYVYTTPTAPTSVARADAGADQSISWSNAGMGYTEYATDIIGVKNGVSVGVLGTAGTGVTSFLHTTTNAVSPYTPGDSWKYYTRHVTTSGPVLYSYSSAYTSETSGATSAPNPPTGLTPDGGNVDPSVVNALAWVHNPTDTTAQTQFQIRHRVVGAGTWTTESVVTSAVSSWNLPAATYTTGQQFEWQVTTKGADAAFSAWSDSAVVTALVVKKVPLHWNLGVAAEEADLSGFDWVAPSLLNSWVNFGAPFGNAAYCRRGGIVRIRGVVKLGTINAGATGNIFVLPTGFRPSSEMVFSTMANNAIARVELLTDGSVRAYAMASNAWLSLDNISFVVDTY